MSADEPAAIEAPAGASTTRLILIRHGESNVTVRRVIGGFRTCDGLSALGREQAQRLAARLADTSEIDADVVIASNFARALETAETLLPALRVSTLEVDPAFGEHDPGPTLDGMSFVSYVERFGTPDWGGDPHTVVFPGGETTAQFHLRVGAALSTLVAERAGSTIVIVCHGGVIDATFRQLLRAPATGSFELHTANTSITEFVAPRAIATTTGRDGARDERGVPRAWRLVRYNDASHLAGLPAATERA